MELSTRRSVPASTVFRLPHKERVAELSEEWRHGKVTGRSEMSRSTREVADIPPSTLMQLITSFMPARLVHVAAHLGIADLLANGSKTAKTLARETKTHAPSLHRLLRALVSLGLLDEIEPNQFTLTATGAHLRTDMPGSLRNLALMFGGEQSWQSWGDLLHSVRTGESASQHLYGLGSFEYLAAHPKQALIFNEAMADITRQVARALAAAYDFSRFRTVVDVGGGNGTLIAAILAGAPALRGIVFDLLTGNAEAPQQLAAAGVAERCEVVVGDFLRSVPNGADAYILKSVIHDWDDDRSVLILKNCHRAMSAGGKLLLVERVMPARMEASPSHQRMAMIDMNMLAVPGGRERTEAEYRALFAAAGFALVHILPLSAQPDRIDVSLIEAAPV